MHNASHRPLCLLRGQQAFMRALNLNFLISTFLKQSSLKQLKEIFRKSIERKVSKRIRFTPLPIDAIQSFSPTFLLNRFIGIKFREKNHRIRKKIYLKWRMKLRKFSIRDAELPSNTCAPLSQCRNLRSGRLFTLQKKM